MSKGGNSERNCDKNDKIDFYILSGYKEMYLKHKSTINVNFSM